MGLKDISLSLGQVIDYLPKDVGVYPNLTDVKKNRLGSYSVGIRQRIGIAQAIINDPR